MINDIILELISKVAKTRDVVLSVIPSAMVYLLDAWQDIIPWLTEDEAGGIFAVLGYSVSKLYDLILGEKCNRKNEIKRATKFVNLIVKIKDSEKINSRLRSKIEQLIDTINHKIEMAKSKIITPKQFSEQFDKLVSEFDKEYEKIRNMKKES